MHTGFQFIKNGAMLKSQRLEELLNKSAHMTTTENQIPDSDTVNCDRASTRTGALALYTAGGLFWAFLPYFISLQMDVGGLSQTRAGLLGSGYLLGFTLASVSALWWVPRFNWRLVSLIASVVIIITLHLLQGSESYIFSFLCVATVGLMMGSFWAIYYRIFGRTSNPDHNFAIGIVVSYTALAVISYVIASYVIPANGLKGAAYVLAAIIAVLGMVGLLIPRGMTEKKSQTGYAYRPPKTVVLALIGILGTGLAFACVWTFAERIGMAAGLGRDEISPVIASNLLASAGGSLLATMMGVRMGRRLSLFVGLAVMASAIAILYSATSIWFYAASFIGLGLAIGFVMPYQMGVLATLDGRGHFVVLIAAVQGLGSAAGPVLGGLAADISGVSALLTLALFTLALSGVSFAVIDKRKMAS